MPRKYPATPKYPTSFHQEVDVKEYLDELINETGYHRSELINQIIRQHREQREAGKSGVDLMRKRLIREHASEELGVRLPNPPATS